MGSQLLAKLAIAEAIEAATIAQIKRIQMTADEVLAELAMIAQAQVADVMEWDDGGTRLRPMDEVSQRGHAALAEITEKRSIQLLGDADSPDASPVLNIERKVKMHNKIPALLALAKYHGLMPPDGPTVNVDARSVHVTIEYVDVPRIE
jgi:hypothetical protein